MKPFTSIKGLTDRRRLPRLGKIRLGIKKKSRNTGKEYPAETEYFVCTPEVQKIYGPEPKELDVMFVSGARENIFPVSYTWYGSGAGVKCQGNGEEARRKDDNGNWEDRSCPCELLEQGKCKQVGHLMVLLPKVNMGGIYQITTSSYNSIVDVISGLDYVESLLGRTYALVPLKLRRIPTPTHHDNKRQTHYTLQVVFDGNIDYVNQLNETRKRILIQGESLALPEPEEKNPEFDEVDVVEDIKDEEPMVELNEENRTKDIIQQMDQCQYAIEFDGLCLNIRKEVQGFSQKNKDSLNKALRRNENRLRKEQPQNA